MWENLSSVTQPFCENRKGLFVFESIYVVEFSEEIFTVGLYRTNPDEDEDDTEWVFQDTVRGPNEANRRKPLPESSLQEHATQQNHTLEEPARNSEVVSSGVVERRVTESQKGQENATRLSNGVEHLESDLLPPSSVMQGSHLAARDSQQHNGLIPNSITDSQTATTMEVDKMEAEEESPHENMDLESFPTKDLDDALARTSVVSVGSVGSRESVGSGGSTGSGGSRGSGGSGESPSNAMAEYENMVSTKEEMVVEGDLEEEEEVKGKHPRYSDPEVRPFLGCMSALWCGYQIRYIVCF